MSRRHQILASEEIYHVFNRSVGHEEIFTFQRNLHRVIELVDYYRFSQSLRYSQFQLLSHENQKTYREKMGLQPQLIDVYTFALMPNHYHFLLKQIQDRGITTFIANLQNSFAKYFNLKYSRHGALFQSPFKAKRVSSDEEFNHISRYIHLNPVTSYMTKLEDLANYPWTSFISYMQNKIYNFVNTSKVLSLFSSKNKYYKFVANQEDYQKRISKIKHLILE